MTAVVLRADARHLPLPDGSVDLIVTSPPYFGLRDYGYVGQIGSEATPTQWLDALLTCTKDWIRVLKPEGSLFVNLGDKYANSPPSLTSERVTGLAGGKAFRASRDRTARKFDVPTKCLLGLPWRYALAVTDQLGLILRAEIVWAKPNGLPESVTDRVRRSHEQLFHFVKQPRYYSAVDEIRDPHEERFAASHRPGNQNGRKTIGTGMNLDLAGIRKPPNPLGKLPGSVWDIPSQPLQVPAWVGVDHFAAFPCELPRRVVLGWSPPGVCTVCGQGRRPVTCEAPDSRMAYKTQGVGSRPQDGGRFAKRLREDGRGGDLARKERAITGYVCGCAPYTDHAGTGEPHQNGNRGTSVTGGHRYDLGDAPRVGPWREYHFDRWTPPPTRPAIVLDPFGGTGTTALVADVNGRTGISCDLSADYCRLARWRTTDPGERAKAMQVPKPPPVPNGQEALFPL